MNKSLIAKWNSHVNGNDTVYIVGDLFFRCNDDEAILKHLRGKKRLIVGNHEGSWLGKVNASKYFASVDNLLEISDGQTRFDPVSLSSADMEEREKVIYDPRSHP